jgi:hypothetical protein
LARTTKFSMSSRISLRLAPQVLALSFARTQMHINLDAPIEAGKTAAGFKIGSLFQEYAADFAEAKVVRYYAGFNLVREIKQNTGVLRIDGFREDGGSSIYFGPDTVRLDFTGTGLLVCIYVWTGYTGAYGEAKIGAPLATVSRIEPLAYDSGDDMYYRVDVAGDYIAGLAIIAMEVEPAEHSITPIHGFCVHDWSLFARAA